jgi:hypothetical protein
MRTGMFRVKQSSDRTARGSGTGLNGPSGGLNRPKGGLDRPDAALNRAHMRRAAAAALAIMLAGCSSPEDIAQDAGVAQTATATATASATPSGPVSFEDNSDQNGRIREFAYKWPAAVSAIPALAGQFTVERDKALLEQKSEWEGVLSDPDMADCMGCANLSSSKEWKVVATLPRYLSLSADMYFYSGGAHGNSAFDALVWDREAGKAIAPRAMFRSDAALQEALGAAWCKALLAERIERVGEEYAVDDIFPCPPIADLTLLLGSSNKQTFNRIGLIAATYVAGSYAEGPYEVTLPVSPALLAAVKPKYKSAFAQAK